jgi:hypothetical protein
LSKNLNKGPKAQVIKARELNIDFAGVDKAKVKDTDVAFEIPLNWLKEGTVKVKFLTIKLEFNEVIEDNQYIKSVSVNDADKMLEVLCQHMTEIATANGKDNRNTSKYTVTLGGADFHLESAERPAKETDARRLMSLSKWVTRKGHVLDASSSHIPSYLYLLEKHSVVFECEGHKHTVSAKEAAVQLLEIADGEEPSPNNVLNVLGDKIQTPMYKEWRKAKEEFDSIAEALQREIDKRREDDKKAQEAKEREELEKEVGSISTEVINRAMRYEALVDKLKDKVALLTGLRGKPLDVLLGVQGALAQGNKDRAVELAFDVNAMELAFLKECYINKSNLKWMRDNKEKFEATQG